MIQSAWRQHHLGQGVHPDVTLLWCVHQITALNGPSHTERGEIRAF